MADDVQSITYSLAPLEGLVDGVEPATYAGAQRTNRAGVPIWRVMLSVRSPGERRRSLDILVVAAEAPVLSEDTRAAVVAPTITIWRNSEGRSGHTIRAERVDEVAMADGASRLPTAPSRGQR